MTTRVSSWKYFLSTLSSVGIKTYILEPCFPSEPNFMSWITKTKSLGTVDD